MLKVSLNDMPVDLAPNTSLADALPQWIETEGIRTEGIETGSRFVIAVNKEFVPRSAYAAVVLQDGDEIDLVRPVWGG